MDNDEKIKELNKMLRDSSYAVFFGGAGVSTESGLPDFRSPQGLGAGKYKYSFEYILSHEFFYEKPDEFYEYYFTEMARTDVRPNAAHIALARLERAGRLKAVITQNIDGLHQEAGSEKVYELHGSVHRNACTRCGKRYDSIGSVLDRRPVPRCDCGGLIKPDVVLYGEPLDENTIEGALRELARADLVIVGGTSLSVYPAAGFLNYTRGRIAVVNKQKLSSVRPDVALEINDGIGRVLEEAAKGLI